MKKAVYNIVADAEARIEKIINYPGEIGNSELVFEYGVINVYISVDDEENELIDPWDSLSKLVTIEVLDVIVTNEKSEVLKNVSKEVENQIQKKYTNF